MTENPTNPLSAWPSSRKKKPVPQHRAALRRGPGSKNGNRRDELLRRLNVDPEALAAQPEISPMLKKYGILPGMVIETLRADGEPESRKVVALWDSLPRAEQNILGLKGLSMAAGLNPRRLWELFNGTALEQGWAILLVPGSTASWPKC